MSEEKMLANPNESKENEQSPLRINDETARYLWNLAQKSNLTVTTAKPANIQCMQIKQELKNDFCERIMQPLAQTSTISNFKETAKTNWKHQQQAKNENIAASSNPFAALPLSLIKNGILSVTSDSACVEIENGVPILKETNDPSVQSCLEQQKSAITIEPVPMKIQPSIVAPPAMTKEKIATPAVTGQPSGALKTEQLKIPIIENTANAALFQRKMLMQNQILKTLIKHTGVRPLAPNTLIPNSNQMEFAALLGLELVTEFCLSDRKPTPKLIKPDFCAQCGVDFSPRWHSSGTNSSQKLCERCFFWHMRLKNTEERTKQYQAQIKIVQKNVKLPLIKVAPPMPTQPVEPQQLFKNYLNALMSTGANCYDSSFGFSDLTKFGASIAANPEIVQAMDNLRSLNNAATPELRAKAIQNLQLAFYKGLSAVVKTTDGKAQSQESLLRHYQLIVAQMAQKAGLTSGSSTQTTQRRTGAPLEIFERAIKEHKQRLLKTIQNTKS